MMPDMGQRYLRPVQRGAEAEMFKVHPAGS